MILRLMSQRARTRCVTRLGRDLPWTHPLLEVRWKWAAGGFTDVSEAEYVQVRSIPGVYLVREDLDVDTQGRLL